jgi:Raf kinase inhibitor-like YbhB/YbcL family protein
MKLTSSAFENGAYIPSKYTCEGENISPPLSWDGVLDEAQVIALVVDDPDAPNGTFTHWVIYNIPKIPPALEEDASLEDRFSQGLREGFNDFGHQGYGGPCPPRGAGPHRYFFRLYALTDKLSFTGRVTRGQLMDAIHVMTLDETILLGLYTRA